MCLHEIEVSTQAKMCLVPLDKQFATAFLGTSTLGPFVFLGIKSIRRGIDSDTSQL